MRCLPPLFALLLSPLLLAQEYRATLLGVVTDQSGAIVLAGVRGDLFVTVEHGRFGAECARDDPRGHQFRYMPVVVKKAAVDSLGVRTSGAVLRIWFAAMGD